MDDEDKKKEKDQEKTFNKIKDSYSNGRLVPFVGAGFSKNVKGFLSWEEFIQKLSKELGESKYFLQNKIKGQTFQVMAAEYYACRKLLKDDGENTKIKIDSLRGKIQDAINSYLGESKSRGSNIHKLLLDMFSYIYTTNWDKLFEYQSKEKENVEPVFSIGKVSELPILLGDKNNKILIKMHGTCDEADSIVALETDYWDLIYGKHKNLSLNLLFQHDIMQRDFLFIGFSFTDLNIINLIYIINKLKSELDPNLSLTPRIFMLVLDDYDKYLKRYYADLKNVEVYFLENVRPEDYAKAIEQFLLELQLNYKLLSSKEKKEKKQTIWKLKNTIPENYEKYLENEIKKLEKKKEFYLSNIESICKKIRIECEKLIEIECEKLIEIECEKLIEIECEKLIEIECEKLIEIECEKLPQEKCKKSEKSELLGSLVIKLLKKNEEALEPIVIEFLKKNEPLGPIVIEFLKEIEIIELEKKRLEDKREKINKKKGVK